MSTIETKSAIRQLVEEITDDQFLQAVYIFLNKRQCQNQTVRECTINRFVVMFYRITESNQLIEILSSKDNRSQ